MAKFLTRAERTTALEQGLVRWGIHGKFPVYDSAKGLEYCFSGSASTLPGVGLGCPPRGGGEMVVREQDLWAACTKRNHAYT